MTVRAVALTLVAVLAAGCSKTEEAKQTPAAPAAKEGAAATPVAPAPGPAPEPMPESVTERGSYSPAAETAKQHELETRAAAAEARARLAEIELQQRNRQDLERQQLAAQAEAARAAVLAEQARALDAENAALRARALESEQRAVEAERAAYGTIGNGANVIIVQPPQRGWYGRPSRPQDPPHHEPPPTGAGTTNVGLNRPAVPDLTPPGAPAPLQPFAPKVDTMRARKSREAEAAAQP